MTTAFVLAGGGSIGAVQVGMLRELLAHGVKPDLVVGSSVGAINGAYLAGAPSLEGVQKLEAIWRNLRRRDVFPITWRSVAAAVARRAPLVDPAGLRELLETHLPYRELERTSVPLHVVATDILGGALVKLSSGSAVEAVLASCAIPGAFPPVRVGDHHLVDGAVVRELDGVPHCDLGCVTRALSVAVQAKSGSYVSSDRSAKPSVLPERYVR